MLASTLITLALAEYASRDDFQQIGKGSKVRHGLQWLFRAAVVGLACWLDDCALYALPLALLFSAVFRWRLNGLRRLDWRYVSPSNWFDWIWLMVTVAPGVSMLDKENWTLYHGASYLKRERYTKDVHRAGTMAYIFEAVCFVAGTVWYIWA